MTTRTASGSRARAFSNCAFDTSIVTGSNCAIAAATAQNAACAGFAPSRQLSGRSGQIINTPSCGANSAGIK